MSLQECPVSPASAAPAADLSRLKESRAIMERALAAADIFTPYQKANIRLMSEDLRLERLVWRSVPFRLLFEFNRRCNVQCVHCDIKRAGTGELSPAVLERLLDQIGWGVQEIMPFVGGEPTLAPVHAVAPLLRRHNVWLNMITNGQLFNRAFFEPIADITARVQFSIHSHDRQRFQHVAPQVDFDTMLANLRDAVAIAERTQTHIVPCIVAMDDVIDDMPEYVSFLADLGVQRLIIQKLYEWTHRRADFDPILRRDPQELHDRWAAVAERGRERRVFIETNVADLFGHPDNVPRSRSRFDFLQDNVHIVELFRPGFCIATATQTVVEWDGTVLPCIKDHIVQGNLHRTSFLDLWNGQGMQDLRRTFFEAALRPYCAQCKNFYLGHP